MKRSAILIILALVHCLSGPVQADPYSEGVTVLSSDSSGIIMEVKLPQPSLREFEAEGELYHEINLPASSMTGQTGKPNLPVKGTIIGLPEGSSPTLTIIEDEAQILTEINLRPAPQAVMVDEDSPEPRLAYSFIKDAETYGLNAFFPDQVAELGAPAYMRDQLVARLKIFPVQYNPTTQEVQYHSRIVLRINYGPTGLKIKTRSKSSFETLESDSPERNDPYEGVLKNLLLNYDEVR